LRPGCKVSHIAFSHRWKRRAFGAQPKEDEVGAVYML
jgi:hypothetical protein